MTVRSYHKSHSWHFSPRGGCNNARTRIYDRSGFVADPQAAHDILELVVLLRPDDLAHSRFNLLQSFRNHPRFPPAISGDSSSTLPDSQSRRLLFFATHRPAHCETVPIHSKSYPAVLDLSSRTSGSSWTRNQQQLKEMALAFSSSPGRFSPLLRIGSLPHLTL